MSATAAAPQPHKITALLVPAGAVIAYGDGGRLGAYCGQALIGNFGPNAYGAAAAAIEEAQRIELRRHGRSSRQFRPWSLRPFLEAGWLSKWVDVVQQLSPELRGLPSPKPEFPPIFSQPSGRRR
jgi:hypothetical protein